MYVFLYILLCVYIAAQMKAPSPRVYTLLVNNKQSFHAALKKKTKKERNGHSKTKKNKTNAKEKIMEKETNERNDTKCLIRTPQE